MYINYGIAWYKYRAEEFCRNVFYKQKNDTYLPSSLVRPDTREAKVVRHNTANMVVEARSGGGGAATTGSLGRSPSGNQ